MHIHVGSNVPGYQPESEAACFGDLDAAMEHLRHALKDQQDAYYERCTSTSSARRDLGSECCEWCSVATDVEGALSAVADRDAAHALKTWATARYVFTPPEGSHLAHWAMAMDDDQESCDIYADQEA